MKIYNEPRWVKEFLEDGWLQEFHLPVDWEVRSYSTLIKGGVVFYILFPNVVPTKDDERLVINMGPDWPHYFITKGGELWAEPEIKIKGEPHYLMPKIGEQTRQHLQEVVRVMKEVGSDRERLEHFDLSNWLILRFPDWDTRHQPIHGYQLIDLINECGSSGCAIGHCMTDSYFSTRGLLTNGTSPSFRTSVGWSAVRKFFGIGPHLSQRLFNVGYHSNTDPSLVRARIEALLAGVSYWPMVGS